MANPVLYHKIVTAPGATPDRYLFILPGIFGQGRNWHTVATRLTAKRPSWSVVLVDLRMHGHSQGFLPPHTLEACARDLEVLEKHLQLPIRALAGHSFGGKVALTFAANHSTSLDQVWLLDSTPEPYEIRPAISKLVPMLRSLPMPQPSRELVARILQDNGLPQTVAQWLATNLVPTRAGFVWRVDFDALEALLTDYYNADLRPFVEKTRSRPTLHFVKASQSHVLSDAAYAFLSQQKQKGRPVFVHQLPDSGHWLHVDNPDGLLHILAQHL